MSLRLAAAAASACLALVRPEPGAAAPAEADVDLGGDLRGQAMASSVLADAKQPDRYGAARAFDGDMATAWCEGAYGPGGGHTLELRFVAPREIRGVALVPGFGKSAALYKANNRLSSFALLVAPAGGGEDQEIAIAPPQEVPFGARVLVPWFGEAGALKIRIDMVRRGTKYDDTCVAEMRPVTPDAPGAERTALELLGKIAKPGELLPIFAKAGARVAWSLRYAQKDRPAEKSEARVEGGTPGKGWAAVADRLGEDGGFAASEGAAWITVSGEKASLELVGPMGAASSTRMTATLEKAGGDWVVTELSGTTTTGPGN